MGDIGDTCEMGDIGEMGDMGDMGIWGGMGDSRRAEVLVYGIWVSGMGCLDAGASIYPGGPQVCYRCMVACFCWLVAFLSYMNLLCITGSESLVATFT